MEQMGPTLLTKKKNESGRTSIVYKDFFFFFFKSSSLLLSLSKYSHVITGSPSPNTWDFLCVFDEQMLLI